MSATFATTARTSRIARASFSSQVNGAPRDVLMQWPLVMSGRLKLVSVAKQRSYILGSGESGRMLGKM